MGNSPVDKDISYMREVWGTTSLTSDYWSLPKEQPQDQKVSLNEVNFDQPHIMDMQRQVELHEKIRNDDDYDDWEYGTEPDIGRRNETLASVDPFSPENVDRLHEESPQQYNKIPKRY